MFLSLTSAEWGPLKLKMLFRATCQVPGLTEGQRGRGAGGQAEDRDGELSPGREQGAQLWVLHGPSALSGLQAGHHPVGDSISHSPPGCPQGHCSLSGGTWRGESPHWGHRLTIQQQPPPAAPAPRPCGGTGKWGKHVCLWQVLYECLSNKHNYINAQLRPFSSLFLPGKHPRLQTQNDFLFGEHIKLFQTSRPLHRPFLPPGLRASSSHPEMSLLCEASGLPWHLTQPCPRPLQKENSWAGPQPPSLGQWEDSLVPTWPLRGEGRWAGTYSPSHVVPAHLSFTWIWISSESSLARPCSCPAVGSSALTTTLSPVLPFTRPCTVMAKLYWDGSRSDACERHQTCFQGDPQGPRAPTRSPR